ncbi:MAG: nitrilase-related carbon-nitrogen hydrolase [Microgenomates group bacterium]
MNFLRYLASKRTDYFYNFLLFVGGFICLSQGVNEQTRILAYLSSFFFVLLIKRLRVWSSALTGLLMGAGYGYFAFIWLAKFADFTAFHLAVAFNSVLFGLTFLLAHALFKRFPKSLFIHIFGLSVGIFVVRTLFHYSPFLGYAKAFLTLVNTTTVFDWLVPFFGSSITDILVLATGSLGVQIFTRVTNKKGVRELYPYIIACIVLLSIPLLKELLPTKTSKADSVKVALLQGNFNWSWDDRLARSDEIFQYYSAETRKAAGMGARIVIWPEYAVPVDILHSRHDIGEKLAVLSTEEDVVIVTGSLELITDAPNPNGKWTGYDVSLVYDPKKILLEPYRAIYPISNNVKAGNKRVVFGTEFATFPVISCFEVAYHGFVAGYSNLDKPFDFLIGIANIQLFVGTDGAKRIQDHIRRVAMENGKYFIYVSNTGPSLVIDPSGEIIYKIPSLVKKSVVLNVPKIKKASFYSRFQELPLIVLAFVSIGLLFRAKRQRK